MKDGIYYVKFSSNSQDFCEGIAVVESNIVNGGDFACVYRGRINGGSLTLNIDTHDKTRTSVFGTTNCSSLILTLSPVVSGGHHLSGHVDGMPQNKIEIQAKYISELLE